MALDQGLVAPNVRIWRSGTRTRTQDRTATSQMRSFWRWRSFSLSVTTKTVRLSSRMVPAVPFSVGAAGVNTSATTRQSARTTGKTAAAVEQQVAAMGSGRFEVGLFNPDARAGESVMIPRVWDAEMLVKSVSWLRHQNRLGRNIYVRPKGEHDLSMVDDLTSEAVTSMKEGGFNPAIIVETSSGNYQAWLKHPERLDKEVSTAAARALAEKFGGDRGAADWRHFGRLAGFTNRKAKYFDASSGLYPFVRLIEASRRNLSRGRAVLSERKRRHGATAC